MRISRRQSVIVCPTACLTGTVRVMLAWSGGDSTSELERVRDLTLENQLYLTFAASSSRVNHFFGPPSAPLDWKHSSWRASRVTRGFGVRMRKNLILIFDWFKINLKFNIFYCHATHACLSDVYLNSHISSLCFSSPGLLMFGSYSVINVIVLLNLLIAMVRANIFLHNNNIIRFQGRAPFIHRCRTRMLWLSNMPTLNGSLRERSCGCRTLRIQRHFHRHSSETEIKLFKFFFSKYSNLKFIQFQHFSQHETHHSLLWSVED